MDESLSMSEALAAGVRLWHSYLWFLFLSTLLIMLGVAALIIPGIILFIRYAFGEFVLLCEAMTLLDRVPSMLKAAGSVYLAASCQSGPFGPY